MNYLEDATGYQVLDPLTGQVIAGGTFNQPASSASPDNTDYSLLASKLSSWGIWGGARMVGATAVAGAMEATTPFFWSAAGGDIRHDVNQQVQGGVAPDQATITPGSVGDAWGMFSGLNSWLTGNSNSAPTGGPASAGSGAPSSISGAAIDAIATRVTIVVLGLIFVGVGLTLFRGVTA